MMVVDSLILYVGVQSGSDCASATAVAVTATTESLSMASSRRRGMSSAREGC